MNRQEVACAHCGSRDVVVDTLHVGVDRTSGDLIDVWLTCKTCNRDTTIVVSQQLNTVTVRTELIK